MPATGIERSIFFVGTETVPLFAVHYGVLFLMVLVGTLLFVRSKHPYRTQATAVVVAAVAPWTIVVVQDAGFAPARDSIAFAVSGMALTVGLYRFKTLDPVPAARETIVEQMGDGVIILDGDDAISSLDPTARGLLAADSKTDALLGTRVEQLLPNWSSLASPTRTDRVAGAVADRRRPTAVRRGPGVAVPGPVRPARRSVSPTPGRDRTVIEGDRSRVLEMLENLFRNSLEDGKSAPLTAEGRPADGGRPPTRCSLSGSSP